MWHVTESTKFFITKSVFTMNVFSKRCYFWNIMVKIVYLTGMSPTLEKSYAKTHIHNSLS